MTKKLTRSKNNRMVAGVCGGIGEYLDIDPTIIRIIAIVVGFATAFTVIIAYLLCAIIIPEAKVGENAYENQTYSTQKTKEIIGVILIAIGAMIFFDQFIWWLDKGSFTGLAIAAIGGLMIYFGIKEKKESDHSE